MCDSMKMLWFCLISGTKNSHWNQPTILVLTSFWTYVTDLALCAKLGHVAPVQER